MKRAVVACAAALLVSACGGPAPVIVTGGAPTAAPAAEAEPAAPAMAPAGEEALWEHFDAGKFARSTTIDNRFMPLRPGTRYVYEGTTVEDDGTVLPHRIEINVTDLTKEIGGVRSVATWDLDYSDGELVEAELAFFAQDDDGNVWRMGEYPEVYEGGAVVEAPTWIHGFQDARAGVAMWAAPQAGTPSYSQGWGPAVDWTDRGKVAMTGQAVCVPVDCYRDVLVIAETSQAEPGAEQLKYWAPGIGNIRTGWRGAGEKTKETLELTRLEQLSPAALAEVREQALLLEQSAYERSKDVYANTPPMGEAPPAPAEPAPAPQTQAGGAPAEIVVYASDLPEDALFEFEYLDDPAAPGGRLVGIPNNGDEMNPPPENDPHVTFQVPVQGGVPYRCWVHMKVGTPKGLSQANLVWVQFSDALDSAGKEVLKPGTASYLTAQGPQQEGWTWVGCDAGDGASEPLVSFAVSGPITVRVQAGMEGVGFDQIVLSPARFLESPPAEAVVTR